MIHFDFPNFLFDINRNGFSEDELRIYDKNCYIENNNAVIKRTFIALYLDDIAHYNNEFTYLEPQQLVCYMNPTQVENVLSEILEKEWTAEKTVYTSILENIKGKKKGIGTGDSMHLAYLLAEMNRSFDFVFNINSNADNPVKILCTGKIENKKLCKVSANEGAFELKLKYFCHSKEHNLFILPTKNIDDKLTYSNDSAISYAKSFGIFIHSLSDIDKTVEGMINNKKIILHIKPDELYKLILTLFPDIKKQDKIYIDDRLKNADFFSKKNILNDIKQKCIGVEERIQKLQDHINKLNKLEVLITKKDKLNNSHNQFDMFDEHCKKLLKKQFILSEEVEKLYEFNINIISDLQATRGYLEMNRPNYKKAYKFFQQSIMVLSDSNETTKAEYLCALSDAAYMAGDYEKVLEPLDLALKIAIKDKNQIEIANIYDSKGRYFERYSDYSQAMDLYKKAIEIRSELMVNDEKDKKNKAQSYLNISLLYNKMHDIENAKKNINKYYSLIKEFQYSYLGDYYLYMASIYTKEGNYEDAEQSFKKAFENIKLNFGENHMRAGYFYKERGCFYVNQARYQNAINDFNNAITIIGKELGETHPDTLEPEMNRAFVYYKLKKREYAENQFLKIEKIIGKKFGDHYYGQVVEILLHRSSICIELSKFNEALELSHKALTITQKQLGDNASCSPFVAKILNNIGYIHYSLKMLEEAEQYYNRSEKILKQIDSDKYNFDIVSSLYNNYSLIYARKGDFEKAENFCKIALSKRCHAHPADKVTFLNNLAQYSIGQGKMDQANQYYDNMYEILKGLKEHPDYDDLINIYKQFKSSI